MTRLTSIVTPWYRRGATAPAASAGSVDTTRILDHGSAPIVDLVARSLAAAGSEEAVAVLAEAHAIIRDAVRPVYALEEATPASRTLTRGSGSCSQRLAILESAARAIGVPTRVRALLIDRSFWYPRFPRIGFALPDRLLLAWPEFRIGEEWRSASELFGPIGCRGGDGFSNEGAETLFEAAGRCAVDWDGRSHDDAFDLSRFVRADHGWFDDRDTMFARLGQSLCLPARVVADPVMRRISAERERRPPRAARGRRPPR